MGIRVNSQGVSIASGATISATAQIQNAALCGLILPDLTSSYTITAQVAASVDATSAQFFPLYKADGSGQWTTGASTGARAFAVSPDVHVFEAIRFISSPAQIGTKDLVFVSRQL